METVLSRYASGQASTLTPLQNTVDQAVSSFMEGVTDKNALIAMTAGGFAYRLGRFGTLLAGSRVGEGAALPLLVRGSSYAVGFGAESLTFAGVNRGFKSLEGQAPAQSFAKDWAHSALTLAPLKIFPSVFKDQNFFLQHFVTDAGIVAGNQLAADFHAGGPAQGDLFAQFFHAEAMNWQMKGSVALLHGLAPGYAQWEKILDWQCKLQTVELKPSRVEINSPLPVMAMEGGVLDSIPFTAKVISSEVEGPSGPERRKSGFFEKGAASEKAGSPLDPKEALPILENGTREEALAFLERIYADGKLGELILAIEQKYMPGVDSPEFQRTHEIWAMGGEKAEREFLEKAPKNDPEAFEQAREILKGLKADFLRGYLSPSETPRARKMDYVRWYLGLSDRGVPMELSWISFVRRRKTRESLQDHDPIEAKRLYEKAKRNERLLNDLFQIAQLSLFLNAHRKNHYDDSKVPHFRDLILGGRGVCASFSCLFSDMASLIGLKIYTGRAPQHVYLYTDWKDLFIETTRYYNLRLARNPKHYTENFETERTSPADVILGQIEYLEYSWARMPTDFLKLRANLSTSEKDLSRHQGKLAFRYLEEGKVEEGTALFRELMARFPKIKIPMDGPDSLEERAYGWKEQDPRIAQSIQDFASTIPKGNQDWMKWEQDTDYEVSDLDSILLP
ncbi:MAG: hypothetical protein U1F57_05345 [bacterium]